MDDNKTITWGIGLLVAGVVACAALGRGCYIETQHADVESSKARSAVGQTCIQSTRATAECRELMDHVR